jgi:hypothetical protein
MRRLNSNLYPKDGYWFKDRDGVTHRADTWAGVVARVVKYRQRAGQPPGDPANEVTAQACERNPILCNDDSGARQDLQRKASLKSYVLAWMNLARTHKAEGRTEYVDSATAVARADVCATCKFNVSLQESCAPCQQVLDEIRKEVLGRRTRDPRLNACLVLTEDLQTAAHLERPTTEHGELPGNCWRKRTL